MLVRIFANGGKPEVFSEWSKMSCLIREVLNFPRVAEHIKIRYSATKQKQRSTSETTKQHLRENQLGAPAKLINF